MTFGAFLVQILSSAVFRAGANLLVGPSCASTHEPRLPLQLLGHRHGLGIVGAYQSLGWGAPTGDRWHTLHTQNPFTGF